MSKNLQIGTEVFQYPENGTNPSAMWGEEATAWAEAVTELLATIFGPNDISLTTYSLSDNQVVPADIVGLKFSTTAVLSVEVEYIIERIKGAAVYVESGKIYGNYDGTDFYISTETIGEAGISIDVTNIGQFTYTSTNIAQDSCTIKFSASTIAS